MVIRGFRGMLLICLSFLAIPNVLADANSQGEAQSLILSDENIGPLKLDKDTKLELQELRRAFAGLSVEQNIGQQDGPDFVYFLVSGSEGELFWIKADDDNPKTIDSVHVVSMKISDRYGLRIGSTYREILRMRPGLTVETDYHLHTYIGDPKENIVYELAVEYQKDYEGPDREPTAQELAHSIVTKLIWFPR